MGLAGGKIGSNPPDQARGDIEGVVLPHKAHMPHCVIGPMMCIGIKERQWFKCMAVLAVEPKRHNESSML